MLELERTFLLKNFPHGLFSSPHEEMMDIYLPLDSEHAHLRLRKKGEYLVIMKKELIDHSDLSAQQESVIHLSPEEFFVLSQVPGKRIHKQRYYFPYQEYMMEIDVFCDALTGLVLADVEFPDEKSKAAFTMPEFFLCEVTQDMTFAGGILCGKGYKDIEDRLKELGYKKLET